MTNPISSGELAALMASPDLYAVCDVRERGEYNLGHVPYATSLPRSQIESRILELVPNRNIPIVLCDGGEGRAALAARTLADIGYSDVAIVTGGLTAWRTAGFPVASGVNVPSKAFGERVHHDRKIPDITPEDLISLQARGADLMVLDVRTPEEYGRFCIPGAINVPGGDLVLWAAALKQLPSTEIVINCAGRTRSIVGAATLKRLGVPNVRALRNGTMGWLLAGLELEKNPAPVMPQPPADSAARARELAQEIAREEKIARMPAARVQALQDSGDGALYLVDVRSENEYRAGHLPGSISVPGGQAVQRADDFIAVRNGQIVFISNESARAVLAAYWYRQMGFPNVSVLDRGIAGWRESGGELHRGSLRQEPYGSQAARNVARFVEARELQQEMRRSSVLVLDVGTSADFESAHIPGARWIPRGWLELELPKNFPARGGTIVVACGDEASSVFAARTLSELGYADVRVLSGGVEEWTAAGYPVEKGLEGALVEAHDVVLSPSIRGDRDEMQRYLEWELNLTRS